MNRKRVGILIFPDVEVLDFCGPFEVFSVTRLDEGRRREEPSPFEVLLVAETAAPIVTTADPLLVSTQPVSPDLRYGTFLCQLSLASIDREAPGFTADSSDSFAYRAVKPVSLSRQT